MGRSAQAVKILLNASYWRQILQTPGIYGGFQDRKLHRFEILLDDRTKFEQWINISDQIGAVRDCFVGIEFAL